MSAALAPTVGAIPVMPAIKDAMRSILGCSRVTHFINISCSPEQPLDEPD
jgi:hypothetical protein